MRKTMFGLSLAPLSLIIVAPLLAFAAPDMSETLDAVKNKYSFNGPIYATVTDGETLYIGGGFETVSINTGQAVLFDELTEESQTFPKIFAEEEDTVYAIISDGDGGWYVTGDFTDVGGEVVDGIAHILSDGSLDLAFLPTLDGATGKALALSSDGGTLYVGGNILTVNGGTVRRYVAAFDTDDGSLLAFNPLEPAFLNGSNALALSPDDAVLYVGSTGWEGGCSLFAFDTATGNPTGLFDCNSVGGPVSTITLSGDGDTLYVGGDFTLVDNGGTPRNRIAAFDTDDGSVLAFNPDSDDTVYSLLLNEDESLLYAGGSFSMIGEEERSDFAAINTTTGLVTALDAGVSSGMESVFAIGLSTDGETIYLGGRDFTQVGGQQRQYFAEIDADTGLATSFDPELNGNVYALAVADGQVLIGGSFTGAQEVTRSEVAAIDLSTYELTDFDPDIVPHNDNTTYALALSPDNSVLYIGGEISGVNGGAAERSYLAGVYTDTSLATAFDPDLDGPVVTLAVSSNGTVYAGGSFTSANDGDFEQPYLAAFDPSDGAAVEAFTPTPGAAIRAIVLSPNEDKLYAAGSIESAAVIAFDPSDGSTLTTAPVVADDQLYALALSPDGETLYVGGGFSSFSAGDTDVGEGFIADAETGESINETPDILSTNASTVYASIPDGEGGWYVGGTFNRINGEGWNSRIAHILSDGTVDEAFEPDFGGESGAVYALALSENGETLYAGGQFLNIGAEERVGLAAFDTSDGSLLSFDPSLGVYNNGALVRALELDGTTLYIGGKFTCVGYDYDGDTCVGGSERNNLAAIDTGTGLATAFDPNIGGTTGVYDIDISEDGEVLYVGGGFTQVNGDQSRTDFAAFSLDSETLGEVTALDPGITSAPETVHALAESSDGSTVYLGGSFYVSTGLEPDSATVAAVDVDADGGVGAFSETFPYIQEGDVVDTLALSDDDSVLYVGGYIPELGNGAIAFSTADGSQLDAFNPNIDADSDAEVFTIGGPQNGNIFIGGSEMSIQNEGGGTRQGLAALNTSDLSLTDFDPNVDELGVYSLVVSSDSEALYVGGTIDGGAYIASFDTSTGDTLFDPELWMSSGYVYALALSPTDDELYAGGSMNDDGWYAIYSSDEDDEEPPAGDDDDDDEGGGGGSSRRHTVVPSGISSHNDAVKTILEQLVLVLQQLIQELLAQQQN